MTRVTLSGLQRAVICTASVVLPRYDSHGSAANLGSALHEMIDNSIKRNAVNLDEIANAWDLEGVERGRFFALARTFRPRIPAGTMSEVALGLFDDGDVRPVEGGHGQYEAADGLLIAGTIDAMWSEPDPLYTDADGTTLCPDGSTLWVVDWKTGDENNVPPPSKNWQLRAAAVIAAAWTGATRVIPAICFVDDGEGRWDIGAPIEAAELAEIERRLVAMAGEIEQAAFDYPTGIGPRAVTGSHCEHCPARPGCPAHVAEARAMVTAYSAADALAVPLTREEAARLAALLPTAERVLEQVKKAVRAFAVENGPIPLADGRVYGPQHAKRDTYATRPSYEALAAEIGDEAADAAFRTSKGAIYDAIGEAHDKHGIKRKKGAAVARVLERIAATGGKTTRAVDVWTAHHPKEAEGT